MGKEAMVRSASPFPLKSSARNPIAGARMVEAKGVRNVMAATKPTMVHLRFALKFMGISGSSWLSQPTTPLSRSETGMGAGGGGGSLVRRELAKERLVLVVI